MTKKGDSYIFFLFFLCFREITSTTFSLEIIYHAISGIDAKHPIILSEKSSSNINLMKALSQDLQYSKMISMTQYKSNSFAPLILVEIRSPRDVIELSAIIPRVKSFLLVMIDEMDFEASITKLKVQINQKVLFVKIPSLELFEAYFINDHLVKRNLGRISKNCSGICWDENVKQNLVLRRQNFYGKHLKIMTETSGMTMVLDQKYKTMAPYFPDNDTYFVNHFVSGIHHDILMSLQNQLNFSTSIYKRGDGVWGFIDKHSNGSYSASGMVGDIFTRNADIIIADLTYNLDRSIFIDFTRMISLNYIGLYLPNHSEQLKLEFDVFLRPFR